MSSSHKKIAYHVKDRILEVGSGSGGGGGGGLAVVHDAGAYCSAMASNYNVRVGHAVSCVAKVKGISFYKIIIACITIFKRILVYTLKDEERLSLSNKN